LMNSEFLRENLLMSARMFVSSPLRFYDINLTICALSLGIFFIK